MRVPPQAAAIAVAFAILVTAFGARTLIELDTVGLVLAIDQQDLRAHQPTPPGSILYLWFAQFCNAWIGNAWWALRVVSLSTLLGAALVTAHLAARLASPRAASLALLAFLASPLVLFCGMTASSFAADALVASLTALLCVRALQRAGSASLGVESYLIGLAVGLRAQSVVFALPLWGWTLHHMRMSRHQRGLALVAWLTGITCWALPEVQHAGGLGGYLEASWTLARHATLGSVVGGAWGNLAGRAAQIGVALLAGMGVARVLWILVSRAGATRRDAMHAPMAAAPWTREALAVTRAAFWSVWLVPILLWTLLYSLPAPGALLGSWPALCVLFAIASTRRAHGRLGSRRIIAAIVLDVLLFFAVPVSQLSGPARIVFGDAVFFHERVESGQLAAVLDTLRSTDVDTRQALFLTSQPAHRALAYWAPEMPIVHADALRPYAMLVYRERRARTVGDAYEVPAEVRWVIAAGRAGQFSRAQNALLGPAWPRVARGGLEIVRVGPGPIDAWFVPERSTESALHLHLVRGLPPSDPSDAASERAGLQRDATDGSRYGAATR